MPDRTYEMALAPPLPMAWEDYKRIAAAELAQALASNASEADIHKLLGPSGFSVGKRVEMCHDRATASRASRAMRGAFGAPGPRGALAA